MKYKNYELKRFMPLTSDTMFKEMFSKDENKELLSCVLSIYLQIPYKDIYNNIKHLTPNLELDQINKHKYDVDIVLSYNNKYYGIEMNKSEWPGILTRNISYAFKSFSNQFNSGGDYHKKFEHARKFIQISINNYDFPKDKELGIYRLKDIDTNEELTDMIEFHQINLAKISDKKYNNISELTNYERLGKLMLSENLDDIEKVCDDIMEKKDMEKVLDKLVELNSNDNLWMIYDKEELNQEILESSVEEAEKRGEKLGLERGANQRNIEIAKKMLEGNYNIEEISKLTGLSKNEIVLL